MTLMPVSKISDWVDRRASGGGARCTERHWTSDNAGFAVDGVAEDIEHAREDALADRRLQRPARVLDRHAAREPLRGRQRNAAHVPRIQLRQHLDDDLALHPPRAATSRSAANAHRTGYPRRCRAPRRRRRKFDKLGVISISRRGLTMLCLFRHGARSRRGPQGLVHVIQPPLDPRPILRGGEGSIGQLGNPLHLLVERSPGGSG